MSKETEFDAATARMLLRHAKNNLEQLHRDLLDLTEIAEQASRRYHEGRRLVEDLELLMDGKE